MEPVGSAIAQWPRYGGRATRPHVPFLHADYLTAARKYLGLKGLMSTFTPNESRLGSSWLSFPQPSSRALGPLPKDAEPAIPLINCISGRAAEIPKLPAVSTATETLSYSDLEAQSNALARHLDFAGRDSRENSRRYCPRAFSRARHRRLGRLESRRRVSPASILLLASGAHSPPILEGRSRPPFLVRSGSSLHRSSYRRNEQNRWTSRTAVPSCAPILPRLFPTKRRKSLNPAYVIYTSGSTGRPKGVEITSSKSLEPRPLASKRLRRSPVPTALPHAGQPRL